MPAAPFAQVLVSINGGPWLSGGIQVPSGAAIALEPESTVGWVAGGALWEIYQWPVGWAGPGGTWTLNAASQVWQNTNVTPSSFVLPANTTRQWGKFGVRLTVNGNNQSPPNANLVDDTTWLSMLSLNGLEDVGFLEGPQFYAVRQWVEAIQNDLRAIDAFMSSGGGGGGGSSTTVNFVPVLGPATVAAQPGVLYGCDVRAGAVHITVASITAATVYSKFGVLAWKGDPSVGGHGITIDNPAGGDIQDPENIGTLSATAVAMTVAGEGATWFFDGANLVIP